MSDFDAVRREADEMAARIDQRLDPGPIIAEPDQVECEICGRFFKNANGLGVHKSTTHGPKRPKQKRKQRSPKLAQLLATPTAPDGLPDWSVDDIFTSVVSLMWPGGEIPMYALMPLVRWREDTQRMLDEVRDGHND